MPATSYAAEEIVRRGTELYERDIRAQVEAENRGKYLSLDILTGDYAIGHDAIAASRKLRAQHPEAIAFGLRIGYPPRRLGGPRIRIKRQ
jgi:hypothetical protein